MDLNEIRKKRLVNSYINGAIKYNLLMGKKYEITVENGNVYEIEFNKEDYKHLCGIQSTLNDRDFFDNCLKSTITTSNINTKQQKDWNSLKGKERIIQIGEKLKSQDEYKKIIYKIEKATQNKVVPMSRTKIKKGLYKL